jgi:AcrR family transcriptional regulator
MSNAYRRKKQPELIRQQLLAAAAQTVIEKGAHAITLDGVAKQAGVSKGGLLHHFPSKQALLDALFQDLLARFNASIAAKMAEDPEETGRAARAYLHVTTQETVNGNDAGLWRALTAAMLADPALHERWAEWGKEALQLPPEAHANPAELLLCRLAVDGLWLADMLGYPAFSDTLREDVLRLIDQLSRNA